MRYEVPAVCFFQLTSCAADNSVMQRQKTAVACKIIRKNVIESIQILVIVKITDDSVI